MQEETSKLQFISLQLSFIAAANLIYNNISVYWFKRSLKESKIMLRNVSWLDSFVNKNNNLMK